MAKPWKIVDLNPSETLKGCLRKIAQTRFQETFSYEAGTIKGENIESLHDMRVSARRLRAVLKIFRACFPKKKFRREDEKLQTLIRALGAVREKDVFIEFLVNYRKTLGREQGKVLDLLLVREQSSRAVLRRQMMRSLRLLRKANYAVTFNKFLRVSL